MAELSLDLALQQFLDHLKVERQLASATLEAYGTDLAAFCRFVPDVEPPTSQPRPPGPSSYIRARCPSGSTNVAGLALA